MYFLLIFTELVTRQRLTVALIFLLAKAAEAGIEQASPQVLSVTRGDRVHLEAKAAGSEKITWFFEGRKIKEGQTYDLSTGEFSPGEYRIMASTQARMALDILTFRILVSAAPVLYSPKIIKERIAPTSAVVQLRKNQWWIAALEGKLSEDKKILSSEKVAATPNFLNAVEGQRVLVGSGSDAVAVWANQKTQVLAKGRAVLGLEGGILTLSSGRFIWRMQGDSQRGDSDSSPKPPTSSDQPVSVKIGKGLVMTAEGRGDVVLQITNLEKSQSIEMQVIGHAVSITCRGEEKELLLRPRPNPYRLSVTQRGEECAEIKLQSVLKQSVGLSSLLREFFPHWFDQEVSHLHQLLRLDLSESEKRETTKSLKSQLSGDMKAGNWASALDSLVLLEDDWNSDGYNLILQRGIARLELGFTTEAQEDFKEALQLSPKNPFVAKEFGRARAQVQDHSRAREWYILAETWGHPERADLNRLQSGQASALGKFGQASTHLVSAFWNEANDDAAAKDFTRGEVLNQKRTFTGVAAGGVGIQSHILPLNPENYGDLPEGAVTNRGLVYDLGFDWQMKTNPGIKSGMFIVGKHDVLLPSAVALSSGSRNDHLFESVFDVQNFKAGIGLGTRIRGGDRQTDELSARMLAEFGQDIRYEAGVFTVRAFDPAPGGADIVDSRINLIVEDADHSHFDLGVKVGASVTEVYRWWRSHLSLVRIDFRTGVLDNYDAQEISLGGIYGVRFWRRGLLESGLEYISRSFSKESSSDAQSSLSVLCRWSLTPKWQLGANLKYFNRSSTMDAVNYAGHYYGLNTTVEL